MDDTPRLRSSPIRLSCREAGWTSGVALCLLALWSTSDRSNHLFLAAALALILSWVVIIDMRRRVVPNALSYPLLALGLISPALQPDLSFLSSVIGAFAAFVVLGGIASAYQQANRRVGLGWGDVKLAAGMGAWVGWQALPWILMIASAAGLVVIGAMRVIGRHHDAGSAIPFAPALCAGFWVVWLFGIPAN